MSRRSLTTYLNDHLAGSVAALELLDHLLALHSGAEREPFTELRTEIEEDQQVVRELLEQLGERESSVRKAAAWLSAKLGQVKLRFDDPGDGELRVLEALEALGLGIQGKLSLWGALAAVAEMVPALGRVDFQQLQQRAADQFERVDELRLRCARAALAVEPEMGGEKI
jgi:hypothetical protein